jgi:hypothetical protein
MRTGILTITAFFIATLLIAQTPKVEWARSIGGAGNERANGIATDTEGYVILVGRFQSPVIRVDDITLTKNTADSADVADLFLIKLDPLGNALWAIAAGGKGDDHAVSCTTDAENNIYVVGWFESETLKLGDVTLTRKTGKGCDMVLAKFSPDGACMWARNAGGEGANGDYSTVTLDRDNHVVVAGRAGTVMDFGDGVRLTGENDGMYVARYTRDGQLLWAKYYAEWRMPGSRDG